MVPSPPHTLTLTIHTSNPPHTNNLTHTSNPPHKQPHTPPPQTNVTPFKEVLEGDLDLDEELREQSVPLVLPVGRVSIAKVSRDLPSRASYVEMADHHQGEGSP